MLQATNSEASFILALSKAIDNGSYETIKKLLQNDPNKLSLQGFKQAAEQGKIEIIKLLLSFHWNEIISDELYEEIRALQADTRAAQNTEHLASAIQQIENAYQAQKQRVTCQITNRGRYIPIPLLDKDMVSRLKEAVMQNKPIRVQGIITAAGPAIFCEEIESFLKELKDQVSLEQDMKAKRDCCYLFMLCRNMQILKSNPLDEPQAERGNFYNAILEAVEQANLSQLKELLLFSEPLVLEFIAFHVEKRASAEILQEIQNFLHKPQ